MKKADKRIIADAINSLITKRMLNHREHHIVKFPFIRGLGSYGSLLYDPQKYSIVAIEYKRKGKTRTIKL